jgi:hypothetical protein
MPDCLSSLLLRAWCQAPSPTRAYCDGDEPGVPIPGHVVPGSQCDVRPPRPREVGGVAQLVREVPGFQSDTRPLRYSVCSIAG